jgi:hypothetical protein
LSRIEVIQVSFIKTRVLFITADRAYGWLSSTSLLGRCAVAAAYSSSSIINDLVLRSAGNLILQSGVGASALIINTSNQAFFRNR